MERNIFREHIPFKKQYEADLLLFQGRLANHILQKHGGIIASTCHDCLMLKGAIRSHEWMIRDIEKAEDES